MSNQACTEHGNTVVVYPSDYRSERCPLCVAEAEIDDLKQQVEDLEAERDSLASEVDDLKGEQ
jgi:hypothetical protein